MQHAPPNELRSPSSLWPIAWWGMYLLNTFVTGPNQKKYLIVAIDYFTKWFEAEALAKIKTHTVLHIFTKET